MYDTNPFLSQIRKEKRETMVSVKQTLVESYQEFTLRLYWTAKMTSRIFGHSWESLVEKAERKAKDVEKKKEENRSC